MVTEFLQQAPHWTAMRCRPLFWAAVGEQVIIDAVMSSDQPDGAEWDTPAGTPFTVVISVTSAQWLGRNRGVLDRWANDGREVEIRRTRAWEDGSQVLVWGPDASLLVTLAA